MRTCFWAMTVGALLALPMLSAAAEAEYEFRGGKWVRLAEPKPGTPEGELAILRRLVDTQQYKAAVKGVQAFLEQHPDHAGREEAMMLAGQAQFDRGRYWLAYEWFKQQVDNFPGGVYAERALHREYQIGDAFLEGKKRLVLGLFWVTARGEGVEMLQRIAEQAPGSDIAERSLLRVADYYYNRGDWGEAVQAYDEYLELFGKSNSAPYARLQAARATHGQFKGIPYDETPLLEAQQRFGTFGQYFPRAAQRNNVDDILGNITDTRAAMTLDTARFYMRTNHPRAAAFYFRLVMDRYPTTPAADEARRVLGLMVDEPVSQPAQAPPATTQPSGGDMRDIFRPAATPPSSGRSEP
ncbi:MAG TPA: outer membrane protein assembly factor BamD [Phycisphaerae bacterium]|nr:outer membrane protein assembly factor BamD [Phycisphaerae bacterium]HQL71882.1 outer membrane protein assembly factor BamD [Phycisphaerae bacterium]